MRPNGYTLIEVILIVACIAVAALLIVPSISNAQNVQLRSAAELVLADLEFAQSQSLGAADDPMLVVFEVAQNRYFLAKKSDPTKAITHPVDKFPYISKFGTGRLASLKDVKLDNIELGGGNRLEFGPYGQVKGATAARVRLKCKTSTTTIEFDPATGDSSVGQIK